MIRNLWYGCGYDRIINGNAKVGELQTDNNHRQFPSCCICRFRVFARI